MSAVLDGTGPARALKAMPLVFVLIWSTGFIVARYGMPYSPPLHFLVLRYVLSIACFLPWILLARVEWPRSRAQWLHLAATGVFMHAGYLGGVWAAVRAGMGAGLVSLLVGLQPVLTAVWLSATSQRGNASDRVGGAQWAGLVLGFAGLLMVLWHKLEQSSEVSALTLSLSILALLSITVGTLYQKRYVQPCDVRTANVVQLAAAALVTLPLALEESGGMHWNGQLVGAMVWSVLGLTLGGSSLLYLLIQRGAATAVTSLLYLVPPCTAFMAWLLFGETITAMTVLGTLLTAAGVALVVRSASRARN